MRILKLSGAHGGQPWQDFLLFESVALGVGGPDFYHKAFVALAPETLGRPVTERVLQTLRRIKPYTGAASTGRDWIWASNKFVNGEAGMQLMAAGRRAQFL